jgi:hypothetical protein
MDVFKHETVPDTKCIKFQSISQYSNFPIPFDINDAFSEVVFKATVNAPHFDLIAVPVRAQVDDMHTKFVRVSALQYATDASEF